MRLRKLITMREGLENPRYFAGLLSGPSWRAWRVLLIAIVGEKLTNHERSVFAALTGREHEPAEPVEEFWAIIGRRGGKTRAMAVLAAYVAACIDHRNVLAPGERGVLPIMAASTLQAGQAFNFVTGIFAASPSLKGLVENETSDTLSLSTGIDIQVRPASYRTIRGITAVAAVADEIAFWRSDDSANPDKEILKALRPSLATTGGLLACISSPHAKRGELYSTFKRNFGPNGHEAILVAKATSRTMNPSLSQKVVDRASEEDPDAASAEYGAEFRGDIDAFATREAVEACVEFGVFERAPLSSLLYFGFVDPSGGSQDSMTIAIAHRESARGVLDAVREARPPFSPAAVVQEFAELAKLYRVSQVTGDRYAGEWPREQFRKQGITYEPSERSKSEIYVELLPLLNSGRVDLLDDQRMTAQLCGLERRTARSGRNSIDHAPGAHDDRINACAGALVLAAAGEQPMHITDEILANAARASRRRQFAYGL